VLSRGRDAPGPPTVRWLALGVALPALDAVTSRLLVPSNYWRAEEVITAVATRAEPRPCDLRDAYREICTSPPPLRARPLPE